MTDGDASALCALCGARGRIVVDPARVESKVTAMLWALHFANDHPDVTGHVGEYVIVANDDGDVL